MKNLFFLFVVCVLCAGGATAQVSMGAVNSLAHPLVIPSHPERAKQTGMAAPQNLMERSINTFAKGERPLWEVMPPATEVPLGDTARALRKEHAAAKKAVRIWGN